MNPTDSSPLHGLRPEEVEQSRAKNGANSLYIRPKRQIPRLLLELLQEPMFLILLLACGLYFAIGDQTEAWFMAVSIVFVFAIEVIQEFRSEKALEALRQYAQPHCVVVREREKIKISTEDVVVDDLLIVAEGERAAADGIVVQQHDLLIDEAILTGESLPVEKSTQEGNNMVYQGTIAVGGAGVVRVTAVGTQTAFGKLGKSIESIESDPTPLQKQINRFVRQMILAGLAAFLLVLAINYHYAGTFLQALLFSLAFAMALIPEEIPVAFTTFMALGAYRMTKMQILVKQPKTVESLGSATVICLDKTGTITENKMSVAQTVDFSGSGRVLDYAMWACEPEPFDAMEKAIHNAYAAHTGADLRPGHQLVHEYPLGGTPPMMTHIHADAQNKRLIACKGAVERIIKVCGLGAEQHLQVHEQTIALARKGFRVLGVASADWDHTSPYPAHQDDFAWQFEGLLALYDPPKANIRKVMDHFYNAGIRVKMITGDYPETALNIAGESGIRHNGTVLTGEKIMQLGEKPLQEAVREADIFARMFPDAKLRVVEALKANGEVVAMTGDGVNDGPALKAAQIGVAMGHKGTEIAKGAASMILLDDDLDHMVTAVHFGRKIYNNLRKAIRYIISIHIPIVLVVLLPLVFGWTYLHMLGPIQVIFLELIMDPTCAVAFENEPGEPDIMRKKPRKRQSGLFSWQELSMSILQGVVITGGILGMYHFAIEQGHDEQTTRGFVFTTLLASNIFLTLVNRSFTHTISKTIRYKNRLLWWIIGAASLLLAVVLFVPPVSRLFQIAPMHPHDIWICLAVAFASTTWIELWKWWKKSRKKRTAGH